MSKKTKITVITAVSLLVVIALAAGVWFMTRPQTQQGEKDITFKVVHKDKTEEVIEIDTDEEFLAKALEAEGIITYEPSGLYTTVNGVTADYNVDGGWWAVYIGGEMAQVGLNEIPITDGGEYEAVYTIGFAA